MLYLSSPGLPETWLQLWIFTACVVWGCVLLAVCARWQQATQTHTRTLDPIFHVRCLLTHQLRTLWPLSTLLLLLLTLLEWFMVLALVLKGLDQTLCCFKWQSIAKLETQPPNSFALLKLHSSFQDLVNSSDGLQNQDHSLPGLLQPNHMLF